MQLDLPDKCPCTFLLPKLNPYLVYRKIVGARYYFQVFEKQPRQSKLRKKSRHGKEKGQWWAFGEVGLGSLQAAHDNIFVVPADRNNRPQQISVYLTKLFKAVL